MLISFTACCLTLSVTRCESHFKHKRTAVTEHKTMRFCTKHLERQPHAAFHSTATAVNWTHRAWWKCFLFRHGATGGSMAHGKKKPMMFTFIRRFYPKQLTIVLLAMYYSGCTFFISMCVPWELNPQPSRCYHNALPLSHRNTDDVADK